MEPVAELAAQWGIDCDYFDARGHRQVVDAQCSAVEDVLQLVRDQSVTMRDPQQVSDQLANLVHDVEQTEQTVQQVESIFSSLTPDMEGILQDSGPSPSIGSAQRTRIGS